MKALTLLMIFLLTMSFLVMPSIPAAGSGGGGSSDRQDDKVTDDTNTTDSNETDTNITKNTDNRSTGIKRAIESSDVRSDRAKEVLRRLLACENTDNRTVRIACRLKIKEREDYDYPETDFPGDSRFPEVCRKLNNKQQCKKLYRAANHCYELENGRQKAKCFKRVAGFVKANINDEDDNKREKTRRYLVYLLYELEERIEHKIEAGELDADLGARLIDQISNIKEDLLNGESKDVIKPKLQNFKKDFREAMSNE